MWLHEHPMSGPQLAPVYTYVHVFPHNHPCTYTVFHTHDPSGTVRHCYTRSTMWGIYFQWSVQHVTRTVWATHIGAHSIFCPWQHCNYNHAQYTVEAIFGNIASDC